MSAALARVHGQLSWRLATDRVEAFVTRTGAHLGPVTFRLDDGRTVAPYHVAPWAEDPPDAPPMLQVLRGDFFCAPFGGNETPFQGEQHPPHGEPANAAWRLDDTDDKADPHALRLALDLTVRPGQITRTISLVPGHTALYQRHVLAGLRGPMSLGHHAMLRFPDREGAGLISTSPFVWAQTSPRAVETPATGGDSALAVGAAFDALDAVPDRDGGTADLSRYPARRGFEDLVMLAADPALPLAWTAVAFPDEGYVWFTLKDPRVLRQTVLWISNGGRRYAPWDGRHVNVLGLEEVTSYFHFGLAESAAPNPLSARGIPTHIDLDGRPLDVRCISAVAAIPPEFDHVARIETDAHGATLTARSGLAVRTPLDVSFLRA
jgi:hypothetical protein